MSRAGEPRGNEGFGAEGFRNRSLGYQVNLLARMMEQALAKRIRPHGVEPGQFAQLLSLFEEDGQSVTDLAARIAIEHSTMSHTLNRMVRDGLVETRPNPADGRSRLIFLTEHARRLEPTLKAAAAAVNEIFGEFVTPAQSERLLRLLNMITEARQNAE